MRRIGILAAAAALAIAAAWLLPLGDWSTALASRIRGMGAAGIALFIAVYVVWAVALLPGALLTLVAGFAYGPIGGLLVASPASVTGATAAFLLGRSAFRPWVQERIIRSLPAARAIDAAVRRDPFKIILLLRLSPVVPFNLLNYASGVSGAPLGRYVAASFIGMLPGTWLYVYLGSLATTAAGLSESASGGGRGRVVLTVAGLVATVAAVALVTRSARRALDRELERDVTRPIE